MAKMPKDQGPGFRDTAKAPAQVVSGNKYFGFDCRSCGKRYAVFDDNTISGKITFTGDTSLFCDCPYCHGGHNYAASAIVAFKAQ